MSKPHLVEIQFEVKCAITLKVPAELALRMTKQDLGDTIAVGKRGGGIR